MKKVYDQPKIQVVALDPEQAILLVCKVGGVWMDVGVTCEYTGGSSLFNCGTPRGIVPSAETAFRVVDTTSAGS